MASNILYVTFLQTITLTEEVSLSVYQSSLFFLFSNLFLNAWSFYVYLSWSLIHIFIQGIL